MSGGAAGGRATSSSGDDELGRALATGLSRAVGGDVDTAVLVRGAHSGARRIHRRRTAVRGAVAAVVVVALVPVGLSTLRGASDAGGSPSAAGAASDSSSEYSAAQAGPEGAIGGTAGGSRGSADGSTGGAAAAATSGAAAGSPDTLVDAPTVAPLARAAGDAVVPDDALLAAGELGLDPVRMLAEARGRDAATSGAALCARPLPGDDAVVGGRSRTWSGADDGGAVWQVSTAARVFAGDGAARQLAALRRDVGVCPGSAGAARETVAGLPGDDVVLAVLPPNGSGDVRAVGVVRRGRTIAEVEVVVPADAAPGLTVRRSVAVERARSLLVRAHTRLADLAARADADPTLR